MTNNPFKKKTRADNFKFALGMGTNWADLNNGYMYMIQEYAEKMNDPKIPKEQKPTKIRIMKLDGVTYVGEATPIEVRERMKDPIPDPKYAYDPPKKGKW